MEQQVKYEVATQEFTKSDSLFFNVKKFEHAQRLAKAFAEATMIPEHYRRNIGNCLIGLNLADRMGADPLMIFQNTYIVHGKPGIEAKLAIALINTSGRFEPLKYEYKMDGGEVVECFAYAREKATGEILNGPEVTWKMVQAEGWDKPRAQMPSKWNTMRKIMFTYRAAMFFARVHIPEALLGFYTTEELTEAIDLQAQPNGTYQAPEPPPPSEEEEREAEEKAEEIKAAIKAEQEDFEREKIEKAQADLERKREQAKKDFEKKENDRLNDAGMTKFSIDELLKKRPGGGIDAAKDYIAMFDANEDEITLNPDREKRDRAIAKRKQAVAFLDSQKEKKEPPNSPGEQEQNERKEEVRKWCAEANEVAEKDVTDQALKKLGYFSFDEVPEVEYGMLKKEINSLIY